MSPDILAATNALREFMYTTVYLDSRAKADDGKVRIKTGAKQTYNEMIDYGEKGLRDNAHLIGGLGTWAGTKALGALK